MKSAMPNTPFLSKTIMACLAVILVTMLLASIHPLVFSSYLLHQAGTLICVGLLLFLRYRVRLSERAFIGATVFLLVHIIGARYLYSYVPYSDWTQVVFGFSLDKALGWHRNMYDRLVHFSYGLLLFGVLFEVIRRYFSVLSLRQQIFLVLLCNMATSLVYEWIEWALAMTLSAETAEDYNGQQGDMWDAHKDMLLALLGGICASIFYKNHTVHPIATR